MQTTPTTGTVSHATMNPKHLIPCFLELAYSLHSTDAEAKQLGEIRKRKAAPGYYDTEGAHYDLEELFDLLDSAAPAGHYFGAHPGDGSDYGYWPHEDDNDDDSANDDPEPTPED